MNIILAVRFDDKEKCTIVFGWKIRKVILICPDFAVPVFTLIDCYRYRSCRIISQIWSTFWNRSSRTLILFTKWIVNLVSQFQFFSTNPSLRICFHIKQGVLIGESTLSLIIRRKLRNRKRSFRRCIWMKNWTRNGYLKNSTSSLEQSNIKENRYHPCFFLVSF